jgi:hypothetical protein
MNQALYAHMNNKRKIKKMKNKKKRGTKPALQNYCEECPIVTVPLGLEICDFYLYGGEKEAPVPGAACQVSHPVTFSSGRPSVNKALISAFLLQL